MSEPEKDQDEPPLRSHHDMGGLPAGPVNQSEHDYALWEKRIDAMWTLLWYKVKNMTVDELRRGIEAIPPEDYDRLSYYERWTQSAVTLLTEKGILSQDEIEARVAEIKARKEPLL